MPGDVPPPPPPLSKRQRPEDPALLRTMRSRSRRQTILVRGVRCGFLPKPTDTVWRVTKDDTLTYKMMDRQTPHEVLATVSAKKGIDMYVFPYTGFRIEKDDSYTLITGDDGKFQKTMEDVANHPGSLGIGRMSTVIFKKGGKGYDYDDAIRHSITFLVVNDAGDIRMYLLDSNGSILRKNDGMWARRTATRVEDYLQKLLNRPVEVHAIDTPNVNMSPNESTSDILKKNEVTQTKNRAWCSLFTFMFIVEAMCTHVRVLSAEHVKRFIFTDILRRPDGAPTLKKYMTDLERSEIMLYANALALRVHELETGKTHTDTILVERYKDEHGVPRTRKYEKKKVKKSTKSKKPSSKMLLMRHSRYLR